MSEWVTEKREETPTPHLRRAHLLGFGLGALAGFIIMIALSALLSLGPGRLPLPYSSQPTRLARNVPDAIFKAPTYTGFINQNGDKVASSAFNGKVRVVSFLFPLCTSMCPVIASHLVNLEHQIDQAGLSGKVRLVSFDVAAGKTSPAQMAAFMREYGDNPKSLMWQFLTSSPKAMDRVVKHGYHEYFQMISMASEKKIFAQQKAAGTYNYQPEMLNQLADKVNPDFDITHSSSLILVDPRGNVRYVLNDADTVPVPSLLKKIEGMLKTPGAAA